jgi:hypothetical protein
MRFRFIVLALVIAGAAYVLIHLRAAAHTATAVGTNESAADRGPAKIDFTTQVRPILARCQPCHFNGGTMYERLPFDRPETVTKLGEKLFTRIRAENERKIIREFLAENPSNKK